MKNKKFLIIFTIIYIALPILVSAKNALFTCEYYKPSDSLSGSQQANVLCDIYSDYSHQCYIKVGGVVDRNSNKEKIQNWGTATGLTWKAKEYVKNTNTCPNYLLIRLENNALFNMGGYAIWAAENETDLAALTDVLHNGNPKINFYPASLMGMEISDEDKKKAEDLINSYIDMYNDFANTSLEDCSNNNANITKYKECTDKMQAIYSNISTSNNEVYNYINQGYFTESDQIIVEYRAAVKAAEDHSGDLKKEINPPQSNPEPNLDPDLNLDVPETTLNCEIFDGDFGKILNSILGIVRFLVPILIIGLSIADYIKAIVAQNQDEIKKSTQRLIKRLIIGVLIFALPTLLKFVLNLAGIGTCSNIG